MHLLCFDFDGITWSTNDPFDKITALKITFIFIVREFKNDDISLLRISHFQVGTVGKRNLSAINELIDQQMITDQQGWQHGPRRNFKGLDHERPYKKSKQYGYGDSLGILPNYRFFLLD